MQLSNNVVADCSVSTKQLDDVLRRGFELWHLEGLQLSLQRRGCAPSPVQVSGCIPVNPWRVVDNEFHDLSQLLDFVRETLHHVSNQHAVHFLSLLVGVFDQTLFHRSPRTAELPTHSKQGRVLVHDVIFEFRASVTPHQGGYGPAPEHTAREHAASFGRVAFRTVLQQDAVAQTTDVSHRVLASRL